MEVDEDNTVEDTQMAVAGSSSAGESKKRFEVKKVRANAVRAQAVTRRTAATLTWPRVRCNGSATEPVERRGPLGVGYGQPPLELRSVYCFMVLILTPPCPKCFITDIVVDNCAICRNHIMDLCTKLGPIRLRS